MMTDDPVSYSEIARTPRFRSLLANKKRFLIPLSCFFFVFYFALPVMTSYFPAVMNVHVIGSISRAWLFAFAQFVMIWTLCGLYVRKAVTFDAEAAAVVADGQGKDHA